MSRFHNFQSWIRPAVTILTVTFFFAVIAFGLWSGKLAFDRALDILSGIFGWVVGHWFGKREAEKVNGS